MAYEKTTVAVPKSQEQIRTILRRAGADRIAFGEVLTGGEKSAGVEFAHLGLRVRVLCSIKEPTQAEISERVLRSRRSRDDLADDLLEQEAKRVWRVLHWALKARMEAVEEGLETFEQAFLPHLVDPATGKTIWEGVRGAIEGGALADNGPGLPRMLELEAGD